MMSCKLIMSHAFSINKHNQRQGKIGYMCEIGKRKCRDTKYTKRKHNIKTLVFLQGIE